MKCPECSNITKNKFFSGACHHCGYQFVFGVDATLYDNFYYSCIKVASQHNSAYFTKNQLYAVHKQALQRRKRWHYRIATLVLAITLASAYFHNENLVPILMVGALATAMIALTGKSPLSYAVFTQNLSTYLKKKPHTKFVDGKALVEAPKTFDETDLYQYGVKKILVCDDKPLVDYLVLNQFFAKEHILVISLQGYPSYLVDFAKKLAADPETEIYCLHGHKPKKRVYAKETCRAVAEFLTIAVERVNDLGINAATLKSREMFLPDNWRGRHHIAPDFVSVGALSTALALAINSNIDFAAALEKNKADFEVDFG